MNSSNSMIRTATNAAFFGILTLAASGQDPRADRRISPDATRAQQSAPDRSSSRPTAIPQPTVPIVKLGQLTMPMPTEVRAIDGSGNNPAESEWGATGTMLLRMAPSEYADGSDAPAGSERASARSISNACASTSGDKPNSLALTDYVWQWGQFIDHDIDLTAVVGEDEQFDIAVPTGDPWFDPAGTGEATIPMDRSIYNYIEGVRQQTNEITAFIDGSNVYGSSAEIATELRANDGSGRLKTSDGNLLPFNTNGFDNAPTNSPNFFLAGDFRANEQIALTAMHTLFMREHNSWAGVIAEQNPLLTGDEIYELARMIVSAEIQSITYNEFLPAMLGPDAIRPYRGYQQDVNPSIANEFSTAAYRFGHSMLSPELKRINADGSQSTEGNITLANAFFNPAEIVDNGIDSILRGLAAQVAQEVDNEVIDGVRNFLFGSPGSGGFDLASLNIQRGRDHGLADFNSIRLAYGLTPVRRFSDISSDPAVQANLAAVYSSVNSIDAWVGGLAEAHAPDSLVGSTWSAIISDQFERLRDGDRFFYRNVLPAEMITMVESQTLAAVIRRNTGIGHEIQDDVFRADLTDQVFEVVDVLVDSTKREMTLTFTSRPGRRYRLESSLNMQQWNVVDGKIESQGILTATTISMRPLDDGKCYRITEQ
ncbi:MAG: hypothetical protein KDN22_09000 [Verrucomicrobiae bacterium]|nr:hypothetical protein [Verrucomicrobiae bacterium]